MAAPNAHDHDKALDGGAQGDSKAEDSGFALPLPRARDKTPSRRSSRAPPDPAELDRPLSPPSPLSPSGKFSFRETVATAAAAGTRQLSPRGPLRVPHPSSTGPSAAGPAPPPQVPVPPPSIGPEPVASEAPSGPLRFTPESWNAYFSTAEDVAIPDTQNVFRVYRGGQGPATFVFVHGGGHTALSWAVVAPKLQPHYATLAFDLRGHGLTRTSDDSDLSADTLVADIILLLKQVYAGKPPPLVLCGHSLGGALVVRVAAKRQLPVVGVVVVDVVEGSAVASLQHMTGVVESIPKLFPSPEKAIEWSLKSGAIRNPESARVSVPPQLVPCTVHTAEGDVQGFKWRTDLIASKPHWRGWFVGLSDMFVTAPAAKLLLLADTDRLDKALTIAQMQGKFELHMIAGSGHCIQEDAPDKTAQILLRFAQRNRFGEPIVPIRKPIATPSPQT